jgi:hypothetical protein
MGGESVNLVNLASHLFRMLLVREQDVPTDAVNIAFLCARGIMFEPELMTNLIQEFSGRCFLGHSLVYSV